MRVQFPFRFNDGIKKDIAVLLDVRASIEDKEKYTEYEAYELSAMLNQVGESLQGILLQLFKDVANAHKDN